jgi:hypothetical protein
MSVPIEKITEERLARWKRRMKESHATPIVLMGVGHDHKCGEIVVCIPEDVDNALVLATLCFAVEQLAPGTIRKAT